MNSEQSGQSPNPDPNLKEIIGTDNALAAEKLISSSSLEEQRRLVSMLNLEERSNLAELLTPPSMVDLLGNLVKSQAVEILDEMPRELAASILTEMENDQASRLLRGLDDKDKIEILDKLDNSETSENLRERVQYEANTAGALMEARFVSADSSATSHEVITRLSETSDQLSELEIQYLFVTENEKLVGVVPLRDLLFSKKQTRMENLMKTEPKTVSVSMKVKELKDLFDENDFIGLPVLDENGLLKGVLIREKVSEAVAKLQTRSFLKSLGIVGGDEIRSMPLPSRSFKRLSWLFPNILLNLVAASVIASFEDTIHAVIALAVFLPMVSDMSGCSGNQSVAVSIRELTLGLIKPRDFLRVVFKESQLGLVNGLIMGTTLGIIAGIWKDNAVLGMVVGTGLAINTVIAVLLGGIIPLILRRFKADPALASGPLLTTCTDMCGFFLVLSFASLTLDYLQ